mmetsp:Transcript_786/g.1725  ORF Transcript_786/g.1725 Transcript_786/m.1725 type:complete len:203 (-) Transcript_786:3038-3646(-)
MGATTKLAKPVSFLQKAFSSGVIMKPRTGMPRACSRITWSLNSSDMRRAHSRVTWKGRTGLERSAECSRIFPRNAWSLGSSKFIPPSCAFFLVSSIRSKCTAMSVAITHEMMVLRTSVATLLGSEERIFRLGFRISRNAVEQWWFSRTAWSLYRRASSEAEFTSNRFVLPGWSTSCTTALISIANCWCFDSISIASVVVMSL